MSEKYTETLAEFMERYPGLVFIRTKKMIHTAAEVDENIIWEDDTLPLIKGQTSVIPIAEEDYPRCLKISTATGCGMWAIYLCEKNGWEVSQPMIYEILNHQEENLAWEEEQKASSM